MGVEAPPNEIEAVDASMMHDSITQEQTAEEFAIVLLDSNVFSREDAKTRRWRCDGRFYELLRSQRLCVRIAFKGLTEG